jgi:hypothetical protein
MLSEISIWLWIALFFIYLTFDAIYILYIQSVQVVKPIKAANLSVILFLLTAYGTIEYVNNFINIIPIIFGAWLGSFLTLKWGKRHSETDT